MTKTLTQYQFAANGPMRQYSGHVFIISGVKTHDTSEVRVTCISNPEIRIVHYVPISVLVEIPEAKTTPFVEIPATRPTSVKKGGVVLIGTSYRGCFCNLDTDTVIAFRVGGESKTFWPDQSEAMMEWILA